MAQNFEDLRRVAIFSGLDNCALHRISSNCSWRHYEVGCPIIARGEQTTDVFFIIDGTAQVSLYSKDGKAVSGLALKATLGRPASESEDITVTLIETPEGIYEAALPPRAAGTYIASIEAVDPGRAEEGILYRAKERLWLKP